MSDGTPLGPLAENEGVDLDTGLTVERRCLVNKRAYRLYDGDTSIYLGRDEIEQIAQLAGFEVTDGE